MSWLWRRVLLSLFLVWAVSSLTFLIIHQLPGDPATLLIGDQAHSVNLQNIRAEMGLDKSLTEQYFEFLKGIIHADFGKSFKDKSDIGSAIRSRMLATAELSLTSFLFSLLVGVLLGLASCLYKNRFVDHSIQGLSLLLYGVPAFCAGPILVLIFAVHWNLLPINECCSIPHLILPALTLSFGLISLFAQQTRAALIETLSEEYLKTARAKGLSYQQTIWKHALPNSLFTIFALIGPILGALLSGTVIVETLFDWPGIGSYLIDGIHQRDYPVIQASVFILAIVSIFIHLAVDLLLEYLHPQVSWEKS